LKACSNQPLYYKIRSERGETGRDESQMDFIHAWGLDSDLVLQCLDNVGADEVRDAWLVRMKNHHLIF
jgi:hypothetical protein